MFPFIYSDIKGMNEKRPVLLNFLSFIFKLIIENWIAIALSASGITVLAIINITGIFYNKLLLFLRCEFIIPLWLIIIVIPIVLYTIIIKPFFLVINRVKIPPYTRMKYGIFELKWNYKYCKETKKYEVCNIQSICKCGCEIAKFNSDFFEYSYCPNCKEKAVLFNEYDAVNKLINFNIKNRTYIYDYSSIKKELL